MPRIDCFDIIKNNPELVSEFISITEDMPEVEQRKQAIQIVNKLLEASNESLNKVKRKVGQKPQKYNSGVSQDAIDEIIKKYSQPEQKETPQAESTPALRDVESIAKKSDADIEKRMLELQDSGLKIGTPETKEFNALEKEMEKRERDSVFNVPLDKVGESVDALMQKEKDMPNGFGAFIEKRDARETKEVADKYLNAKELTDAELKKDFSDAVRGNPTTWYADGLKMREALKEATNRGIDTKDMLAAVTKVYEDAGYDTQTAKSVVANMLKPIFEGSQKVETNESKLVKSETLLSKEQTPPALRDVESTAKALETVDKGDLEKALGEKLIHHGTGSDFSVLEESKQNSATGHGDFGKGFYFSLHKGNARYYSLKFDKAVRRVKSFLYSISSPFEINITNEVFDNNTKEALKKLKGLQSYEKDAILKNLDKDFGYKAITKEIGDARFSDILKTNGFDAVWVNRTLGGETQKGAEIVVFNKDNVTELTNKTISEAYHKAKQDGSNPELVKAVEELLAPAQPKAETTPAILETPIAEVKVKSFKQGDGGTKGVFEGEDGKLYKSIEPQEAVQDKDGNFKRQTIKDKLTDEHEILSDLQDNPHIPKVGKIVNTTEGKAFEIEKLDEVDTFTKDEYREIQKILNALNDKGYHVGDKVTVMKRPKTGELVIVDFSAGYKGSRMSRDADEYMQNVKEKLSNSDKINIEQEDKAENDRFTAEVLGSNESTTEYYLTRRPPSIGTHPIEGLNSIEETTLRGKKVWKLSYDRKLPAKEIENFELTPKITNKEFLGQKIKGIFGNGIFYVSNIDYDKGDITLVSELKGKEISINKTFREFQKGLDEGRYKVEQTPTARDVESTAKDDKTYLSGGDEIKNFDWKNLEVNEGDLFRGVEENDILSAEIPMFSENPMVAIEYARAEKGAGKYIQMKNKFNENSKLQRFKLKNGAKVLDTTKSIDEVNELKRILGKKEIDEDDYKWRGGWKVWGHFDYLTKEQIQKLKESGYDAIKMDETDRDTGIGKVDGSSYAIINKDAIEVNSLKPKSESLLSKEQTPQAGSGDVGGEQPLKETPNEGKVNLSTSAPKQSITKKAFTALTTMLKKAFPKVEFIGEKEAREILGDKGIKVNEMRTSDGNVFGFEYKGKIFLDETAINADTPIHEVVGHYGMNIIDAMAKGGDEKAQAIIAKGFSLLQAPEGKAVLDEIKANPAYSNLSLREKKMEALATIIGREGANMFAEGTRKNTFASKVKDFIKSFYDYIRTKVSTLKDKTIKQIAAMDNKEFIRAIVGDAFRGEIVQQNNESLSDDKVMLQAQKEADSITLKYNGKGQHLAPNGKPSNLTEQQAKIVRTEAFKNWFGDWENDPKNASKVVDKNGEPLVVYHTTSSDFNEFDKKYIGQNYTPKYGEGFYFADSLMGSTEFGNKKTLSVFLNIRNIEKSTIKLSVDARDENLSVSEYAKSLYYDGLFAGDEHHKQFIAFEPNQIKLADGTNTTFNPNTNDIRFQIIGEIGASRLDNAEMILNDLNVAKQMESAGKTPKEIHLATSWEKGADKKWRFELPDIKSIDKLIFNNVKKGEKVTLYELVGDNVIFKAYPELKDLKVKIGKESSFNAIDKTITLSELFTHLSAKSTLIHEMQHAVQDIEGFAYGTTGYREMMSARYYYNESITQKLLKENKEYRDLYIKADNLPYYVSDTSLEINKEREELDNRLQVIFDDYIKKNPIDENKIKEIAKKLYYANAGEVEARNAQRRMNMTIKERKAKMLLETEDIERNQRNVILDAINGIANSDSNDIRFQASPKTDLQEAERKLKEAWGKYLSNGISFDGMAEAEKERQLIVALLGYLKAKGIDIAKGIGNEVRDFIKNKFSGVTDEMIDVAQGRMLTDYQKLYDTHMTPKNKEILDGMVSQVKSGEMSFEDFINTIDGIVPNERIKNVFISYVNEQIDPLDGYVAVDEEIEEVPESPKTETSKEEERAFIGGLLARPINRKNFPNIVGDNKTDDDVLKRITAVTQEDVQDRKVMVDTSYVRVALENIKEIALQNANALYMQFGEDWQNKVMDYLSDYLNAANPAQAIGILNVISTDVQQKIEKSQSPTERTKLFKLQDKADELSILFASQASLGINARKILRQFAQGGNMSKLVLDKILTEDTMQTIEEINRIAASKPTNEELNNATLPVQAPQTPKSRIQKIKENVKAALSSKQKNKPKITEKEINELGRRAEEERKRQGVQTKMSRQQIAQMLKEEAKKC